MPYRPPFESEVLAAGGGGSAARAQPRVDIESLKDVEAMADGVCNLLWW